MPLIPTPRGRREPAPSVNEHGGLWDWMTQYLPARHVGVKPITEGTLMGVPAAWRCTTFIGNALATCAPPVVHQGGMVDENIPIETPPVVANPWPLLTPHEYWYAATISLLLYGNFIGLPADFDPDTGYPRQVVPVHPGEVEFAVENGMPKYRFADLEWEAGEVIHVRGHASPGQLWGYGVIQMHRVTVSESVDHQEYGMNIYGGSAVPPWVVAVDQPEMSEDQAEKLQARMATVRENGNKLPAVIPNTMAISTLAFSPADAQFLEAKRWNATETSWLFGMDPADLGAAMPGASLTYANINERSVERLTHTVGPWIERLEQAWSQFLLPGNQHMHFQTTNLLRTDATTLMSLLTTGLDAGLYTYNECRTRLSLARVEEPWADEPFGKPESQAMPPALAAAQDDPVADPEPDPEEESDNEQ